MKLTVTTFVSLDGVLQSPGGPEEDPSSEFDAGGWLVPYVDEDFNVTVLGWIEDADAFLLGRKTYQILAGHWPNVTDPADTAAAKLNTLPKYVPTRTLTESELPWHNSHALTGDLAAEVASLKSRPGRTLQVHGSGRLIQSLLRHELVDELRLLTFPVVLGQGQRLFDPGARSAWRLTGVTSTSTGVIAQTYDFAGRPAIGTITTSAEGKEELLTLKD